MDLQRSALLKSLQLEENSLLLTGDLTGSMRFPYPGDKILPPSSDSMVDNWTTWKVSPWNHMPCQDHMVKPLKLYLLLWIVYCICTCSNNFSLNAESISIWLFFFIWISIRSIGWPKGRIIMWKAIPIERTIEILSWNKSQSDAYCS